MAVALLAVLFCTACGDYSFTDISRSVPYRDFVGSTFEIVGDVTAYSIATSAADSEVLLITIIPPPGIKSHRVISTVKVEKGTKFRVVRVLKRSNVFWDDVALEVSFEYPRDRAAARTLIELSRGNESNRKLGLNEMLYRRL
jgi:hypothetical protein